MMLRCFAEVQTLRAHVGQDGMKMPDGSGGKRSGIVEQLDGGGLVTSN